MYTFIDQVVSHLNLNSSLGYKTQIILPNRRAGLYLKKKLIPDNGQPRWLPAINSIEDFIFNISGLNNIDNISLIIKLYKSYTGIGGNSISFDEFLRWGPEILKDFEDIDQYLVNAEKLYNHLSDVKEVDLWKPGESRTEFEHNYIMFFKSLAPLYECFTEALLQNESAYQGLANRIIAENPDKYLTNLPWEKIIFAGFNALTPAQLKIIRYLISEGHGEILFDGDHYYMDDQSNEAGHFLRKYREDKMLGDFKYTINEFSNPDKEIYTCSIAGKSGQTRIAGSILNDLQPSEYQQTAVVLADESLLIPLLNSLPDKIDNFNVTMGFPINQTPLYSFADNIFQLHVNAINNTGGRSFYHDQVISILSDRNFQRLVSSNIATFFIHTIKKDNYSYISGEEIKQIAEHYNSRNPNKVIPNSQISILSLVFGNPANSVALLEIVSEVLKLIQQSLNEITEPSTDLEILFSISELISSLLAYLSDEEILIESFLTLYTFFKQLSSIAKVPFYGEPLQGIQIMGMLETRVLDFENIILISANEDTLPSASTNKSFIPVDLRLFYGLPTTKERQSIYAYHFYRLLQRCKRAWIVYNEDENKLGGGEKSRYLQQLEWELPSKGNSIRKIQVKEIIRPNIYSNISIPKDEQAISILLDKAKNGFSFSSLRTYINCSLAFYFTYILKVKEAEEIEEEISSRTMGSILHCILEDIYKPFIGHPVSKDVFESAIANAETLVINKTRSIYPALKIDSGKNLLFLKVAETWLKRFLSDECKDASINNSPVILGVERKIERLLNVNNVSVKLYGEIDRIDSKNGIVRLIDYKTGKIDKGNLKMTETRDLFLREEKRDKQLQLSLYQYLIAGDTMFQDKKVTSGIVSFRSLNRGFMQLDGELNLDEFEDHLKLLFEEILNININFEQTEEKYCEFCNFQQICQRKKSI